MRKNSRDLTRADQVARRTKAAPKQKASSCQTETLLAVGLNLFSKRDFSAVTIKEIAKAAGVTSALLYYYFRNKEDLFKASIEYSILQALDNYVRLKERHTNPVDLINDWFENNAEMAVPFRKLIKIMLDYSNTVTRLPSVDRLIKHFYQEEMSILSSSVRQGVAMGLFNQVDPERAAEFASVHLDGIIVASIIRADFDVRDAIADLKELFWHHLGYHDDSVRIEGREPLIIYER